ncbi:MAG: tetratricopeptide repeat protein [Atribacterota bacterium]|nr:tetratricopeptide repeat protein [Atribacterota bacterium]
MNYFKKIKINGLNSLLFAFLVLFLIFFSNSVSAESNNQLEDLLQSIIEEKTIIPDAYTFINIGNFFLQQELYMPAIEEYQKALNVDPFNEIAQINNCFSYYKMNKFEKALELLEGLTAKNLAHAYYIKGLIHKELMEIEIAIEYYEKAIELIPNHQQINAELGQLYLDNHQLVEANEKFVEMGYMKIHPGIMEKITDYEENAYCYLHLGNYYRENNQLEKAQQAYHQATQFEDDKRSVALAYFYKGEIFLKDSNYNQAILENSLAQKIYPLGKHNFTFDSFAEALLEIGDSYYNKGELPEAFKHYELAIDLTTSQDTLAKAHYKKGLTYYRNQDYENALREAETALSLNPEYLSSQQRLIDLLVANSWSKLTK